MEAEFLGESYHRLKNKYLISHKKLVDEKKINFNFKTLKEKFIKLQHEFSST